MSRITACPLLLVAIGAAVVADEPDDERAYQAAVARQTLRENCLICHSEEMVAGQRLTPAQWKAEVDKMVGWGAPLPKEKAQPLIDFLTHTYPDSASPAPLARMTYGEAERLVRPEGAARIAGDPQRGATLHAKHCASCHGNDGQGAELGPNLVEKPVLLRPADFRHVTEAGRGRMPGFGKVLDQAETDSILAWLRTRRYVVATPR